MKPKRPTTLAIIKHLLTTQIGRKRLVKTFELGQQTGQKSVRKLFLDAPREKS
jgi:hypothetical protein